MNNSMGHYFLSRLNIQIILPILELIKNLKHHIVSVFEA